MSERPIKVLLGKLGLDGHDRGVQVVAQGLVDAGMEVIYAGLRQTPATLVRAALEEDVDVIGVSSLSGAHATLFPALARSLNEAGMEHVVLMGGGVIPEADIPALKEAGFHAVFTPGTPLGEIVGFLEGAVSR